MEWEDMKETLNKMKELIEENKKLQSVKERYIEVAQRLKTAGEELIKLSKDIDPAQSIKATRTYINHDEKVNELFNLLKNGTHITLDLIQKTYPELEYQQAYAILARLKSLKGVNTTKDGTKIRLFL